MIEEKIVIGATTNYPLNGLLSLPNETSESFPAVVLVHGSGPSNMDEQVSNNYPFKDLAQGLSEKGIAVLRYDKRTFVHGEIMKNDTSLSVKEETIEDAVLAADLLRGDSRIDANKIVIIGHSLGGMLAPRIDAEGGDFAGIIIMGGSPRKLEDIMIDQNNDTYSALNLVMRFITGKQIAKMSQNLRNMNDLSDEEAKGTTVLGKHVKAYYFKEMGEHPSIDYLNGLTKPILILQGEKDVQVTVKRDFNMYKDLLDDKPNVIFKLYPNLNHLFMPAIYKGILKARKEYNIPQHVDKKVIKDIVDWIHFI